MHACVRLYNVCAFVCVHLCVCMCVYAKCGLLLEKQTVELHWKYQEELLPQIIYPTRETLLLEFCPAINDTHRVGEGEYSAYYHSSLVVVGEANQEGLLAMLIDMKHNSRMQVRGGSWCNYWELSYGMWGRFQTHNSCTKETELSNSLQCTKIQSLAA